MFLDTVLLYIYDIFENDFIQLLLHAITTVLFFFWLFHFVFLSDKVYCNTYACTGYILKIIMYLYNSYF